MTEAELLALARSEALKTTMSPDEFLVRVKKPGGYSYAATHWYKAMQALEQLKQAPPSGIDLSPVQRMAVIATNSDYVIDKACATGMKVVVCGDKVYWNHPKNPLTDSMIQRAANSPGGLYAWIGPGLHPSSISELHARCLNLGHPLKGWYGEGETNSGFAEHTSAVPKPLGVIGNLSQIRAKSAQQAQVADGSVLFCWERYLNKPDQRSSYYAGNFTYPSEKGFGGFCAAVYASTSPGDFAVRTPMQWYVNNGAWNPRTDSIYTQGMEYGTAETEADWKVLGA